MDQPRKEPVATQSPAAPSQNQPAQPKSHAWIWILGGCFGLAILALIIMLALGWWGARKVKREMEKYTPDVQRMKENADKWDQESEEWQRKSQEFRENMPNPEDLQNQIPPGPSDLPQQQ